MIYHIPDPYEICLWNPGHTQKYRHRRYLLNTSAGTRDIVSQGLLEEHIVWQEQTCLSICFSQDNVSDTKAHRYSRHPLEFALVTELGDE